MLPLRIGVGAVAAVVALWFVNALIVAAFGGTTVWTFLLTLTVGGGPVGALLCLWMCYSAKREEERQSRKSQRRAESERTLV